MNAPPGTRIQFQAPKRTLGQNALLWDILTDIARQVPWHGVKLSADDWKLLFMSALKTEMRIVPNLDNNGFVNLGRSSSKLSVSEMSDLIELIRAWCAKNNVRTFEDERTQARDTGTAAGSGGPGHGGEDAEARLHG
jgi:hypothetical protein